MSDGLHMHSLAWVGGSDAPEKNALNIGYMPLTDCASMVVAATQGFGQPYGLTLNLRRQTSWAGINDKLLSGELDAAHSLYGMIYAIQLGISGAAATDMAILMGLNQNGQSINRQCTATARAPKRHKTYLRPDFPNRHPCHVALLLVGQPGHSPAAGCKQRDSAAAANARAFGSRTH